MKTLLYYFIPLFFLSACGSKQTKVIQDLNNQNDSLQKTIDSMAKASAKRNLKQLRNQTNAYFSFRFMDSLNHLIQWSINDSLGQREAFLNYFYEYPYDTLVTKEGNMMPLSLKHPDFANLHDERFYPFLFFPKVLAWYSARIHPNSHSSENYHSKTKHLANSHDPQQQATYAFIDYFDRSPENIEEYFNKFETTIYQMIDKKAYVRLGLEYLIDDLLAIHAYFMKQDYQQIFSDLDKDPGKVSAYFFETQAGRDFLKRSKAVTHFRWRYMFWYRRYLEGNMKVVHKILTKVKQYYDSLAD